MTANPYFFVGDDDYLAKLNGMFEPNACFNAAMQVARRAVPNLSTSYQFGSVEGYAVKAGGTVGAGTITQDTAATIGRAGYALHVSGATLTGSGEIYVRHRIESRDAKAFKNQTASFAVTVLHDVGSAVTYTITVRKPTVADDFTSVTDIGNNGGTSVASGTSTQVQYESVAMGDCSNGIEIEIKAACGAVTTKNFRFTEMIARPIAIVLPFMARPMAEEVARCNRRFKTSFKVGTAPTTNPGSIDHGSVADSSGGNFAIVVDAIFEVPMVKAPTITLYNPFAAANTIRNVTAGTNIAGSSSGSSASKLLIFVQSVATTAGDQLAVCWTADAEL
jgi:hypothetical protein